MHVGGHGVERPAGFKGSELLPGRMALGRGAIMGKNSFLGVPHPGKYLFCACRRQKNICLMPAAAAVFID
jgi:hypothetical protein